MYIQIAEAIYIHIYDTPVYVFVSYFEGNKMIEAEKFWRHDWGKGKYSEE